MKKFLIAFGILFLVSSVSAYSASFNADGGRVREEIERQRRANPEFYQLRWRVGRILSEYAGGRYDIKLNTVMIDPRTNLFAVRKVMAHEYFHSVWYTRLDDRQRAAYNRLFEYFGASVSDYGREDVLENFADGGAVICYDARWTGGRGFPWRGVYAGARSFFLNTRQGEFISNFCR